MFRGAFKRRRYLVTVSATPSGSPRAQAPGESWRDTKEADPHTFTVVTGPPGLVVVSSDIHDRASVRLDEAEWEAWLTGETADTAHEIKDASEPKLIYHPVPKAVGSPKNDTPALVEPV